ncbi:hypothetical protein [Parachitinimonas caeni]|uniref:Uncharacterized protein n=1 Tax=Parachitinimonas caeni TaxID=3031301 RepID=A0ABT7DZ07_9NEIS|nr:hypothetical protein [Parachitinimonas caeni]MDK2125302.1 hypothetical protein [Parachitinimonas caeni]
MNLKIDITKQRKQLKLKTGRGSAGKLCGLALLLLSPALVSCNQHVNAEASRNSSHQPSPQN